MSEMEIGRTEGAAIKLGKGESVGRTEGAAIKLGKGESVGRPEGVAIRLQGAGLAAQPEGRPFRPTERQPDGRPFRQAEPAVSIIIPVYNMERYLRECLDSVLSQTFREIEAICVDDGSTDSSPAILAEYAAKDSRVKVITQANAGSGPARNAGIAAAKGDWLMFMDPDDYYPEKETVEKLHRAVVASGMKIARGMVRQVGPDGKSDFKKQFMIPMAWPPAGRRSYVEFQSPAGFCQCIFSRELIVGNGISFPPFRRCQDPAFFIKAMAEAGEFWQIDDFTLARRNGYKTIDKKANGGFVGREILGGQRLGIEIARSYGLERIVDHFSRVAGVADESLSARIVRRLCNVGNWTQPLPSTEFVDAFFNRFDKGEFHDANLFKLVLRVLTAEKKIRCYQGRAMLRRLLAAYRNGSLRLCDYGRRRRLLLSWLLFRARFMSGSADGARGRSR